MLAVGVIGIGVNSRPARSSTRRAKSLNVEAASSTSRRPPRLSRGRRRRGRDPRDRLARGGPDRSVLIGLLVLASSWSILRDSASILLESSPKGIDPRASAAARATPGVVEVHDLHVWTITSGFPALSAHVLVGRGDDCHRRGASSRRCSGRVRDRAHDAPGRPRERPGRARGDRAFLAPVAAAKRPSSGGFATGIRIRGFRSCKRQQHRRLPAACRCAAARARRPLRERERLDLDAQRSVGGDRQKLVPVPARVGGFATERGSPALPTGARTAKRRWMSLPCGFLRTRPCRPCGHGRGRPGTSAPTGAKTMTSFWRSPPTLRCASRSRRSRSRRRTTRSSGCAAARCGEPPCCCLLQDRNPRMRIPVAKTA